VYGLEPDPAAAEIARQKAGATVYTGTLDTVDLPAGQFDAVTSMHSIEHSFDPQKFLAKAFRLLRPGGILYLTTPNFGSFVHQRLGSDWHALEVPRHLCLMTPLSLENLIRDTDFASDFQIWTPGRRARRELRHCYAVRQTGSFHGREVLNRRQSLRIEILHYMEGIGCALMKWGEEIEMLAVRGR
jgi:SAM-dependent methyltransferase